MSQLTSPPFIEVPGIHNFRDIGGYAIADSPSSSTRQGLIYRCAGPDRVLPAGKQKIQDLGITCIYDLRSKPEIEKQKLEPLQIDGVERIFAPAFANEDYSPESIALRYKDYAHGGPEGFKRAYRDILENAGPSYGKILRHIRDRPSEPLLLHCTAGKDRTGVIIALIMSIAGASDETISSEYALTDVGLAPMRPVIMEHLLKEPSLNNDKAAAERMISAKYVSVVLRVVVLDGSTDE